MNKQEIARLASEYQLNKRKIEKIKAANDRIKALLSEEVGKRGGDTLTAGEYKLTVCTVTSARVNTERLKKEMPSVYEAFSTVTSCTRFNIR